MPGNQFMFQIKTLILRHRFGLQDILLIGAVLALGLLFAWQLDIFPDKPPATWRGPLLETDELIALAAVFFGVFAWTRYRSQKREMHRRIAAEADARNLALEDALTGLPNRRRFDEALKAAFAAPPRAGGSHAVLVLDLNGFKKINDVYGHPIGDEALIQVTGRLRKAVRGDDLVARIGGDEFAVLSQHLASAESATGLALRIIEHLQAPIMAGGMQHQVGAGVGLALSPQDASTPAELMRKADLALYRAKSEGRNALRFFEPEMDRRIQERERLERDLKAAIGTPALRPFYQPLVDLKTRRVIGFEALARWHHPEFGEIEPDRFIPLADDTGLINELSDHLLRQACRDAVGWSTALPLSFNISPMQLRDRGLGARLLNILQETGLAPERLEIEITESALVRDLEMAQEILGGIREAGVRIALDDFGTGYSSLYHLRNFKLDKIKIDRSFIENMTSDSDANTIVKALIGLGSGLSLAVTAEGVEDEEQRARLAWQGCSQAQGFLFSKAVAAEDVRALLDAERARGN